MEYVTQSDEPLSENIKVTTVLEHAPEPFKSMLRNSSDAVKGNFASLRNHVRNFHNETRSYEDLVGQSLTQGSDPVPMQVDAVTVKRGKGGKKGKGNKGGGKMDWSKTNQWGKQQGKTGKGKQQGKNTKGKSDQAP